MAHWEELVGLFYRRRIVVQWFYGRWPARKLPFLPSRVSRPSLLGRGVRRLNLGFNSIRAGEGGEFFLTRSFRVLRFPFREPAAQPSLFSCTSTIIRDNIRT
jgi:hypothetical protein